MYSAYTRKKDILIAEYIVAFIATIFDVHRYKKHTFSFVKLLLESLYVKRPPVYTFAFSRLFIPFF